MTDYDAKVLEKIFSDCFRAEFSTVLEGGAPEPLYRPSPDPTRSPHRVLYRDDFFASALHETAHWCLAGPKRREVEDYGYWYVEDGRSLDEQVEFERVEAKPQALEWIFADACAFEFHLSADNLESGVTSSGRFEVAVRAEKENFLQVGLPKRAQMFHAALLRVWT